MRKFSAVIVTLVFLFVCTACWADQDGAQKGILDLPFPWNIIGAAAAILLIGTFLFRMIKRRWWWKKEDSWQPPEEGPNSSEQETH